MVPGTDDEGDWATMFKEVTPFLTEKASAVEAESKSKEVGRNFIVPINQMYLSLD